MTEKIEKHLPHLLGLPDQLVSSFVQSCPTLCDPKHCSMPGFLVHYQLPSPTCSNSYSSVQWCHPTISSSVVPFSSCLQFSPESGSFPISQFLTLGGQSIGASVSASLLPMNIQDWFPLRWTGLISFVVQGTFKSLLWHHSLKASVLQCSAVFMIHLSHSCVTSGRAINLSIWTIVGKVMFLLFNMLIIVFLPRRKCLLISWL